MHNGRFHMRNIQIWSSLQFVFIILTNRVRTTYLPKIQYLMLCDIHFRSQMFLYIDKVLVGARWEFVSKMILKYVAVPRHCINLQTSMNQMNVAHLRFYAL